MSEEAGRLPCAGTFAAFVCWQGGKRPGDHVGQKHSTAEVRNGGTDRRQQPGGRKSHGEEAGRKQNEAERQFGDYGDVHKNIKR